MLDIEYAAAGTMPYYAACNGLHAYYSLTERDTEEK